MEEAEAELAELEPELEPEEPELELEPEELEPEPEELEPDTVELEPEAEARGTEAVMERKPEAAAVPLPLRPAEKPETLAPELEPVEEPVEDLPEVLPVAEAVEAVLVLVVVELGQVRSNRGVVLRVSPTIPKEGLAP